MRFPNKTLGNLKLVCSAVATLILSAAGPSMLSVASVWAEQSEFLLPKTNADQRREAQDRYYALANQIFLLEHQQKGLRSKVKDAEARVVDLRVQLQNTEQELEQARELLKGRSRLFIGETPLVHPPTK